uniref:Serine aminopeptidase S33 domain-containing protein n=1 Tax=Oryza glumipatula TaxID=40148 RepID=A0A0E0B2K2_9ORYZ
MWAPTASPAAAAGRAAIPSLRRWPAAAAGVRIVVAMAPVKARAPRRLRLCLAVPPPASEMAAAAAAEEEEEEEEGWSKAVELDAAARREMAIRRLQEEAGTGSSRREFAVFETARGDALFTQSWTPVAAADRVKGIVVLLHGLNEHSGRYNHFAKLLNDHGLKVYAMDWIGHGGSDGVHGYVSSLDHAVGDLKEFLEDVVLEENYGLPCFLFGHSTGGAIVLKVHTGTTKAVRLDCLIAFVIGSTHN